MASIVVCGGSMIGLSTAMMLARDGHDVTVLERDPAPLPASPHEAWTSWPRPGVPRTGTQDDGQLMGFAASPRLRADLAKARLGQSDPSQSASTWAVVRADSLPLPVEVARLFELPAGAPTFDGGVAMEATMFLTPPLERVVGQLGHALHLQAG